MEERVKEAMRSSMMDLLRDMMTTRRGSLDEKDLKWLRSLLEEMRSRVLSLTPRRMDLHATFCNGFDVDLMVQMLSRDAMDDTEFAKMGCFLMDRLGLLCAPSQDEEVKLVRYKLLSGSLDFASLLFKAHSIIDEIENLSQSDESKRVREAVRKKC